MYRANIETIDPCVFKSIHTLVSEIIFSNHSSLDFAEYINDIGYELEERTTITNYQGRLVETRLLAPNHRLNKLGATAVVGVALQPGLKIGSLWVMSSEDDKNWMLEHDDGYPITTGESEKLQTDLTDLLANQ